MQHASDIIIDKCMLLASKDVELFSNVGIVQQC